MDEMSDGGRWDIPERPDFQKDLAFGQRSELTVKRFLQEVMKGAFEVKTDRYRNGRMVVECEQNPGRRGWKPSGLYVTQAYWWVYVYSPDGSMVVVPTNRLRAYTNTLHPSRMRSFATSSSNMTRGYLLEPLEVNEMLSSRIYDVGSGQDQGSSLHPN